VQALCGGGCLHSFVAFAGVKSVYQVGIAQPTSVSSLAVSTAKVSKKVVAQRPGAPVPNNATSKRSLLARRNVVVARLCYRCDAHIASGRCAIRGMKKNLPAAILFFFHPP